MTWKNNLLFGRDYATNNGSWPCIFPTLLWVANSYTKLPHDSFIMYPERVCFHWNGRTGKSLQCWVTFMCFSSIDCPLNRLWFFTGDVLQSQIVQELTECRRVSRARPTRRLLAIERSVCCCCCCFWLWFMGLTSQMLSNSHNHNHSGTWVWLPSCHWTTTSTSTS